MNIYPSYVEDVLGEWLRYKVWSDFDRLNDGLWHNPFSIQPTQTDFPKAREYLVDWNHTTDTEIKFPYPVLHSTSNYLKSTTHYNTTNKLKYNVAVGNTFDIIADTTAPPQPFHIFSNKRSKFIYDKYRQLAIQSDLKLIHKIILNLNIIRPIKPTNILHKENFSIDLKYFRYIYPRISSEVKFSLDLHTDANIQTNLHHAPYFTVDLDTTSSSVFGAYIKTQHSLASNINVVEVLNPNISQSVGFVIDLEKTSAPAPNNVYEYNLDITTSHTITADLTVCPSSNVWYVKNSWQEFTNDWHTTCS